uniref:Xaa-pro aminopeptidase 3 n=1 Tax=Tityus serrulatus TaxID=6887 RepID=A0A1S5QN16_TITSE|nr:xaa-pro aminopeptidase 3 [Tityus serrulatus]
MAVSIYRNVYLKVTGGLEKTFHRWCQTAAASNQKRKSVRSYGQPTPHTHPHLMQEGHVVPGLTQEEFRDRRFRLMENIWKHMLKTASTIQNHIVVIPSATRVYMTDKIPYPFRQNTDFLYMTGFQEPDSVLILHSLPNKTLPEHKSILFVQKKVPQTELWEGPRSGPDGAIDLLGIDSAYNIEELEKFLSTFVHDNQKFILWYDYLSSPQLPMHEVMRDFVANCRHSGFESCRPLIQQLRLIKSDAEIKLMKKSTEIASEAMQEVMKSSHPLVTESQLYAKMDFECRIREAEHLAYPPVVAGGTRANIIHYTANNQRILGNEMVLMDAGCEYRGYASDLTRTWPVNGRFTRPQRELYEAILAVQEELIELCASFTSLDQLFHAMCQLIGSKLQELGIVSTNIGKIELGKIAYNYCPHHVGHYLGMDVHDTTLISRSIKLKPGMIITIEPGIYIRENNQRVPSKYRGLGIRIEDDILVTDVGPEVLTAHCPKTIEDIEKLFG